MSRRSDIAFGKLLHQSVATSVYAGLADIVRREDARHLRRGGGLEHGAEMRLDRGGILDAFRLIGRQHNVVDPGVRIACRELPVFDGAWQHALDRPVRRPDDFALVVFMLHGNGTDDFVLKNT